MKCEVYVSKCEKVITFAQITYKTKMTGDYGIGFYKQMSKKSKKLIYFENRILLSNFAPLNTTRI